MPENSPTAAADIADLAEIDRPADRLQPEEENEHRGRRRDLRDDDQRHVGQQSRASRRLSRDEDAGKQHRRRSEVAADGKLDRPGAFRPVDRAVDVADGKA